MFPISKGDTNIYGLMLAVSDITEEKLLEQKLLDQKIQEQKKHDQSFDEKIVINKIEKL